MYIKRDNVRIKRIELSSVTKAMLENVEGFKSCVEAERIGSPVW